LIPVGHFLLVFLWKQASTLAVFVWRMLRNGLHNFKRPLNKA